MTKKSIWCSKIYKADQNIIVIENATWFLTGKNYYLLVIRADHNAGFGVNLGLMNCFEQQKTVFKL